MYSYHDFRKGLKIEIDGTPFEIIEFQHFKPRQRRSYGTYQAA